MNGEKKTKLGFEFDGAEWSITLDSGDGQRKKKIPGLPALFGLAVAASAIASREVEYRTQVMLSMYCTQIGKRSGVYLAPVVGVPDSILVRCEDCCLVIPLADVKEILRIFLDCSQEEYAEYVGEAIRKIEGDLNGFAMVAPTNFVGVKPATDESIRKFLEENGGVE